MARDTADPSIGSTPWIAVALGRDLPPGTALPVVLDGTELVLWRSESGRIALWTDRCPHRGMRLSFGFVRGETLACLYHGWRYGTDGRCGSIPAHPDQTPASAIHATAHPVVEVDGFVFVGRDGEATPPAASTTAWTGVASVTIDRPAAAVAAALATPLPGRRIEIQPVGAARTRLHVAVDDPTTAEAARVDVELLRERLESPLFDEEIA